MKGYRLRNASDWEWVKKRHPEFKTVDSHINCYDFPQAVWVSTQRAGRVYYQPRWLGGWDTWDSLAYRLCHNLPYPPHKVDW